MNQRTLLIGFALMVPVAAFSQAAIAQSRGTIQQQEQQRRQELMRKSQQEQLKPGDKADKSAEAARAQQLYRNLVMEQKLTHEQAIEALRRAGYPTGGIRPVP